MEAVFHQRSARYALYSVSVFTLPLLFQILADDVIIAIGSVMTSL